MTKIIIDGENTTRGRLASYAAKQALAGNDVIIINSEKVILSGTGVWNITDYKELRALNTIKPGKGPFFSKSPEKIMKRAIRGMIPDFRLGRGKVAWKKIRCYVGVPEELKSEKAVKIKTELPKRYITIKELSEKA